MCRKYSKDIPSLHDPLSAWDGLAVPDWYYETDISEADYEDDVVRSLRQELGFLRILAEIVLVSSGILICSFMVRYWI